jgi:transglutaminase-like putative cysteine protease
MSFSSLHKLVAYLIAALGLWALSLGAELSPIAMALIGVLYVASYFVEPSAGHKARYARAWNVALLVFLAVEVARGIIGESAFALGLEFVAFLQISRLFNRHTAREYQQIAVLAFLHLIAGTVLSTELSYAFVFLGFVIVTPWMLALSHLRREIEGNYPEEPSKDRRAVANVSRVLASRRVVGSSFLGGTALMAVPIFAMTGALFLLFPRVGLGFLSFGHGRSQAVAGFSDRVELGGFGVIRANSEVVMRITEAQQSKVRPLAASYRLRGTSFDTYNGRSWTRSPIATVYPGRTNELFPITRLPDGHDTSLSISLEPLREPVVFLPADTVSIFVPMRTASGIGRPRSIVISEDSEVRYRDADDVGLTYTVYLAPSRRALPEHETDTQIYSAVPAHHERVAALARTIVGNASTAFEKTERILHYLRDSGRYRYTLQQPDIGNQQPLDAFLFAAKAGHCEYFSTAMAILLRAVGVPSRNVTGFLGGRYNPYGNYYVLRQGDAHSWVEALIPGVGWQTYDPTPPSREAFGPEEGSLRVLHEMIDALRARWTERVVGFDLGAQMKFFRSLSRLVPGSRDPGHQRGLSPTDEAQAEWSNATRYTLIAVVALVALLLVARYLRRRAIAATITPRTLPLARATARTLYEELDHALARAGHARPSSTTPLEHAQALRAKSFLGAPLVDDITHAYVASRYGDQALSPEQIRVLREKIAKLARPPT